MRMSMSRTLGGALRPCFSIPDRSGPDGSGDLLDHAGRDALGLVGGLLLVDARWYADQLGEPGAERAQRLAAHREADVGHAQVANAQQSHRPLDPPGHQVGVRRLAVRLLELPAQVPGGQVHPARESLDVEGLGEVPVDPVLDLAQQLEVAKPLRRSRVRGHTRDRATAGKAERGARSARDGSYLCPWSVLM